MAGHRNREIQNRFLVSNLGERTEGGISHQHGNYKRKEELPYGHRELEMPCGMAMLRCFAFIYLSLEFKGEALTRDI